MSRLAMVLALCLLALVPAAPAQGSTRDKIIKDCSDDGVLQGSYTRAQIRDARQNLPSDVAEYTDCADVLRRAEMPDRPAGGSGATPGPPGGGVPPGGTIGGADAAAGQGGGLLTPANDSEHQQLLDAQEAGGRAVALDDATISPGAAGFGRDAIRNDVPGSLLVALIALGLAGLALCVPGIRRALPGAGHRLAPLLRLRRSAS